MKEFNSEYIDSYLKKEIEDKVFLDAYKDYATKRLADAKSIDAEITILNNEFECICNNTFMKLKSFKSVRYSGNIHIDVQVVTRNSKPYSIGFYVSEG